MVFESRISLSLPQFNWKICQLLPSKGQESSSIHFYIVWKVNIIIYMLLLFREITAYIIISTIDVSIAHSLEQLAFPLKTSEIFKTNPSWLC
jgi:hypothetical protein